LILSLNLQKKQLPRNVKNVNLLGFYYKLRIGLIVLGVTIVATEKSIKTN